jgi:glutathione synthase/RimK-type ligase-like ATP-grasp enzyme
VRIAFLVPAPDYPEAWDWAFEGEAAALVSAGLEVETRPWTEVGDLSEFDIVLPLLVWGYNRRIADWYAFLERLESEQLPVVNPVALLRWNSDKSYLAELDAKGVPTVATRLTEALQAQDLDDARAAFGCDTLVIKPPVSAAADGTFKINPGDGFPPSVAGERMLIQPWMGAITTEGEYSLMFFGGAYSHAIVKRPKAGDFRVQPHLGGTELPCAPPAGAEALARAALAAAPAEAAYARVDMIADEAGQLRIMELELIEPSLWIEHAPDGGRAYAAAIVSAAERSVEQPLANRGG